MLVRRLDKQDFFCVVHIEWYTYTLTVTLMKWCKRWWCRREKLHNGCQGIVTAVSPNKGFTILGDLQSMTLNHRQWSMSGSGLSHPRDLEAYSEWVEALYLDYLAHYFLSNSCDATTRCDDLMYCYIQTYDCVAITLSWHESNKPKDLLSNYVNSVFTKLFKHEGTHSYRKIKSHTDCRSPE